MAGQYLQKFRDPNSMKPIASHPPMIGQPAQASEPAPVAQGGTPTVEQIMADPEFHAMPIGERQKVMQSIDQEYAGLPPKEQIRVLEMSQGRQAEAPQDDLMASHAPMVSPQPESRLDKTLKGSARVLSPIARPVLEGAGMVGGAAAGAFAGAPTGPGAVVSGLAGAAMGYTAGAKTADQIDIWAGKREPFSGPGELAKSTAENLATGAAYEAGGQIIGAAMVPILKGGKFIFRKASEGAKQLLSKEAMKESAGKVIVAHTSEGPIYAKNIEQAKAVENEIPGLKFTLGQRSNDPSMIKLERAQMRQPGTAAEASAEQIASNNEALRGYYQKNFGGKEGVDDLIGALQGEKASLQKGVEGAEQVAAREAGALPKAEPQETGQKIVETLQAGKASTKAKAGELYGKIPEAKIPITDMLKEFDDIAKPMTKFEDPGNVPPVLSRVKELIGEGADATLADLQGLRSELLTQARQVRSSQVPNERLSARLSQAASSVEKAISRAEGGSGELKEANRFFREDYSQVFKQGTVGDILRKGPRGEATRIPPAQIPAKVWNTHNPQAADDLIKAIGNEPAKGIMRDHAAYDLMKSATDADGKMVTSKLNSWYAKNRSLFKKFGIEGDFKGIMQAQKAADQAATAATEFERSTADRILGADPEKAIANAIKGNSSGKAAQELMGVVRTDKAATAGLKRAFADHIMTVVQTTAKDVAGNPTISNAAFQRALSKYEPAIKVLFKDEPAKAKALETMRRAYEIAVRNTKSPMGGGSDTAENVLTALGDTVHISRTVSAIKGVVKALGKAGKKQVDELVTRAMFDPEFAETLIKATRPGVTEKEAMTMIRGKIVNLEDFRRMKTASAGAGAAATVGAGFGDSD